jgi:hypothetical protein
MCAMTCGAASKGGGHREGVKGDTCKGVLVFLDELLDGGHDEQDTAKVTCQLCGTIYLVQELKRCEKRAEEMLQHCAKLVQRDAVEGRAGLLKFLLHTPEAARLHHTHHLLYQAHTALAVACHTVGAIRERPIHLRKALDCLLAWHRASSTRTTSPEIGHLRFSLGSALLASLRARGGGRGGRQGGGGGGGEEEGGRIVRDADAGRDEREGGELKEIEALLAAAHGDLCTCFGANSVAARRAQAALGKVHQIMSRSGGQECSGGEGEGGGGGRGDRDETRQGGGCGGGEVGSIFFGTRGGGGGGTERFVMLDGGKASERSGMPHAGGSERTVPVASGGAGAGTCGGGAAALQPPTVHAGPSASLEELD